MKDVNRKEMKLIFIQSISERCLVKATLERDAVTFLKLLKTRDRIIKKIQNSK